jgi:hypothetical protein
MLVAIGLLVFLGTVAVSRAAVLITQVTEQAAKAREEQVAKANDPPPQVRPVRPMEFPLENKPQQQPPPPKRPSEPPRQTYADIYARIEAASKASKLVETQTQGGGAEKATFRDLPGEAALLVGFEITYGKFVKNRVIQSFKPLYRSREKSFAGRTLGFPNGPSERIEAKPGYAVGAVDMRTGLCVDAMKIKFMAVTGDRLDPADSYESAWLGGTLVTHVATLGGNGAPIIGIVGRPPKDAKTPVLGLGLATISKDF